MTERWVLVRPYYGPRKPGIYFRIRMLGLLSWGQWGIAIVRNATTVEGDHD